MPLAFVFFVCFFASTTSEEPLLRIKDDEIFLIEPRGVFSSLRTFSISERAKMVDLHNTERRQVVPSARNMFEMRWENGLEALATDYVKGCEYKHSDTMYRTGKYNFSFIGENIWIVNSHGVSVDYTIEGAIKAWANEKRYYDLYSRSCKFVCGHYTQLVWATSYAVGCAVAECTSVKVSGSTWSAATMLICHYGPTGNIDGLAAYEAGDSCSQCLSGLECHEGLCGEPGVELYSGGRSNGVDVAEISHSEVFQLTGLVILAQMWNF